VRTNPFITEEQQQQRRRGTGAHQADAPDLTGERAEAGADLHVELAQQPLPDFRLVDAGGDAHRVERPEPLARRRQQVEADRRQAARQRLVMAFVPRPPRLEPFLVHRDQRFAERVDHRGRQRVMILAPHPVVLEQCEIHVEAAARDLPRLRARRPRDRRHA
jgi:hypothetical protein